MSGEEVLTVVAALADGYERQTREEEHGGELWSTTACPLRAALAGYIVPPQHSAAKGAGHE